MADSDGEYDNLVDFELPALHHNDNGWGPTPECFPTHLAEMQSFFAPFKKSEKIEGVADWNSRRQGGRYQTESFGASASAFSFTNKEEEKGFEVVDQAAANAGTTTRRGRGGWRGRGHRGRGRGAGSWQDRNRAYVGLQQQKTSRWGANAQPKRNRRWRNNNQRRFNHRRDEPNRVLEPSVRIESSWEKVADIQLPELANAKVKEVPKGKDLISCGELPIYNRAFDKVDSKKSVVVKRFDTQMEQFNVTTSKDPMMKRLGGKKLGNIFLTDAILALLMTCPRSKIGWDVVVSKTGDRLIFDHRSRSNIHDVTVNETAKETVNEEEEGSQEELSAEASMVNFNFTQQVVATGNNGKPIRFKQPNPFAGRETNRRQPAYGAYKYRSFEISPELKVVVRCHINCCQRKPGKQPPLLVSVKTLQEFDTKRLAGGWRGKVDARKSGILVSQIGSNHFQMARWTAEAMLAGCQEIKLGFVSRVDPRDSYKHAVLAATGYPIDQIAKQVGLRQNSMWGIFKRLCTTLLAQDNGKYLILKDPNNPQLSLFKTFNHDFEAPETLTLPVEGE